MNVDAAFETPPPSPTVAGGEVEMQQVERQLVSIKRAVASNAREIRKNRSGIQRSKDNARIASAVNAYLKKTPSKRSYSFKPSRTVRRRY